jgi:hypothetical protein
MLLLEVVRAALALLVRAVETAQGRRVLALLTAQAGVVVVTQEPL